MKTRTIALLLIATATLLATTTTQAQDASCKYSFATGSGSGYLQFCITQNGTVYNFQSPQNVEMLSPQSSVPFEGYGICDPTTNVSYYDYIYEASNNWNAPTTLTSTASEVKIERVTSDGLWTLTQTFTLETGPPPYAKVAMELKNNTPETKTPTFLRFANFVPDSGSGVENYDSTLNSTWGYTSFSDATTTGANVYGLMLQNAEAPTPGSITTTWQGVTQNTEFGPNPCGPLAASSGTITYNSGSGFLLYYPTLAKDKSVTITDKYMAF